MDEDQDQEGTTPRRTARETTQREELKAFIASAQKPKKVTPVKSEPRSTQRNAEAGPSNRILPEGDGSPRKPTRSERENTDVRLGDEVERKVLRARKTVNYKEIPPEPMDRETEVLPSQPEAIVEKDGEPPGPRRPSKAPRSGSTAAKRTTGPAKPRSKPKVVTCDGTAPKSNAKRLAALAGWAKIRAETQAKLDAEAQPAAPAGEVEMGGGDQGVAEEPFGGDTSSTTLVEDVGPVGPSVHPEKPLTQLHPTGVTSPESTPPSTLQGHLPACTSPILHPTQSSPSARGKRRALDPAGDEAERQFEKFKRVRHDQPSSQSETTPLLQSSGEASTSTAVGSDRPRPQHTASHLHTREAEQAHPKSTSLPPRTKSQQLAYDVGNYTASLGYQPRHPLVPSSSGSLPPKLDLIPLPAVPAAGYDTPPQSQTAPGIAHTRSASDIGPSGARPPYDPSNPMRQALSTLPSGPDISLPVASSSRAPPPQPVWLQPYEIVAQFVTQQQQALANLAAFAGGWADTLQPTVEKWKELSEERERMIVQIRELEKDKEDRKAFARHQELEITGLAAQVGKLEEERGVLEGEMKSVKAGAARAERGRSIAEAGRDEERKRSDELRAELEKANRYIVGCMKKRDEALDQIEPLEKERDALREEMERLRK